MLEPSAQKPSGFFLDEFKSMKQATCRNLVANDAECYISGMEGRSEEKAWRGILIAVLLVVGLLTPTLDTFVCIGDDPGTVAGVLDNSPSNSPQPSGDALCVHGHCHHWIAVSRIAPVLDFELAERPSGEIYALIVPPDAVSQRELLRPPRV